MAETLCSDYKRMHNVEIRIARIFNTYGPKMHPNDGRVISNFIVQALNNKPSQFMERVYKPDHFVIDDLVSGLINLMNSTYSLPVNLGN